MNDFGLRVGVDGESEFKKALKELNQNMKTLGTEAKLVGSQFDSQDKSVEALTARNEVLTKQIGEQAKKVDLLKDALENAKKKYGENSSQAQVWQQRLNVAQAELNDMNRELDKNQAEIAQSTDAEKDGAKQNEKYAKSLKDTGDSAKSNSDKLKKFGEIAKSVGTAVATAAAAVASAAAAIGASLAKMTTEAAAYSDEVLTLSQVSGISTEKLQEYAYAAELVDVSVETLTGSMKKNLKSMSSASKGTGEAADAYAQLGISVTDAEGNLRNGETVYWELIDALGQIEDDTQRDVLAMTLLGKSAQDLNPLIKAGSEQLAAYGEEAHKAGYVMSNETLAAFGQFDNQLQRLKTGATAAKNALGTILLPALTQLGTTGVDLLGKFTSAVLESNGDISKLADTVGEMIPEVFDIIQSYIPKIISFIGTIAQDILPKVIEIAVTLVTSLAETFVDALPSLLQTIIEAVFENVPKLIDAVINILGKIADGLEDNLTPLLEAVIKGIATLLSAILDRLPEIIRVVTDIVIAVVRSLNETLPLIIETIVGMIPEIVEALIEALPEIIRGLILLQVEIVKNLPYILKGLWDGLQKIFQNEGVQKMITIGKNLIEAMAEGIKSALMGVIDKVKSACNKVVDGVKSFFGIHSPSRVFAGIGENLGLGLEEGFTDTMKSAEKTIANAIPHNFDIDANARLSAINGDSAALANGGISYALADQNEQIRLLKQQNSLLQRILEKNQTIQIGDDVIGRANTRYNNSRGVVLNGGSYAY